MAPRHNDPDPISRDAWQMLNDQLEFLTTEARRLSDKVLVMETRRAMWAAFSGIVLPIITSALTAAVIKLLKL